MGVRAVDIQQEERKNYSIEEWYSCRRKRRFTDRDRVRAKMRQANRARTSNDYVYQFYECQYCGGFHVGRQYVMTRKRMRRKAAAVALNT